MSLWKFVSSRTFFLCGPNPARVFTRQAEPYLGHSTTGQSSAAAFRASPRQAAALLGLVQCTRTSKQSPTTLFSATKGLYSQLQLQHSQLKPQCNEQKHHFVGFDQCQQVTGSVTIMFYGWFLLEVSWWRLDLWQHHQFAFTSILAANMRLWWGMMPYSNICSNNFEDPQLLGLWQKNAFTVLFQAHTSP